MPVLRAFWQPLGVAGGGVGLPAVSLYLHPWYALALAINVAVVLTGAGASRLPAALPAGINRDARQSALLALPPMSFQKADPTRVASSSASRAVV